MVAPLLAVSNGDATSVSAGMCPKPWKRCASLGGNISTACRNDGHVHQEKTAESGETVLNHRSGRWPWRSPGARIPRDRHTGALSKLGSDVDQG